MTVISANVWRQRDAWCEARGTHGKPCFNILVNDLEESKTED